MDFLLATVAFPMLLAALAVGAGLLADRAAGGWVPGVLVPGIGIAALVAVAELLTYWEATAPLTPVALVAVGVAGFAAGRTRLRSTRPDWWIVAGFAAVFAIACAPVLLSGRVTLAGYLLDTTAAFHIAGGEYLVDHARDLARLPDSSFRATMESYIGHEYPSGGQALLGGSARLLGMPGIWLYQPLISLMLAFCALPLYVLAWSVAMPRPYAAAAATLASVPALVYAYAQMGAIKEITALPFVFLLGAILINLRGALAVGWRGMVVPAIVAAAGLAAIGVAFGAWLGAAGVVGVGVLAAGVRRGELVTRRLVAPLAAFAAVLVVLALPTFGPLSESVTLASNLSADNAAFASDPGNLVRPLLAVQAAGTWIGGSHRFDPKHLEATFILIGLTLTVAALGIAFLARRRRWTQLAFAAALALVLVVLTRRGTTWTDAKLLVLVSPLVVLLAAIGIESLRQGRRRIEAAVLGVALAAGILASDAFVYHDTNLAPTERYDELMAIGERFAGNGPTLLPEFDEFALYALDEMAPSGAGFAQKGPNIVRLRGDLPMAYGHSYDLDSFPIETVERHRMIVMRRRPDSSRPPASFRLEFRGRYYDVWRRAGGIRAVAHEPAGEAGQPAGEVDCSAVRRMADTGNGELRYVARPRLMALAPASVRVRPPGWVPIESGVALGTPGRLEHVFRLPVGGSYRVWLKGDFARALRVSIDGRPIGEVAYESGNDGNFATPLQVALDPGRHRIEIERGGGGLKPGDGSPSRLLGIVFELARERPYPVSSASASEWQSLCQRPLDWVEVVAAPKSRIRSET